MVKGLSYVERDSAGDRKIQKMKQSGFSFWETWGEGTLTGVGRGSDIPYREYIIWFKTPEGFTYELRIPDRYSDSNKKSRTADLIGKAWRHYNALKKAEKMEEFLSEIDNNRDFISEIYENYYSTPIYRSFSGIINKARILLQFKVKI